jgi:hypothetical protein
MARRYKNLKCQAILPNDRPCGHDMTPVGERHPAVLNHPGHWAFLCGYCGAGRLIDAANLDKYAEKA